ncbi:MAG: PfkB family carbohydrate kinase, partial [Bacteroidales bacterium]|nr:PfkB family carbohydrate kinase [Bacteroidales bacterium]
TALKIAKHNGLKVSLDMASFNVVEDNLEFLLRIVRDYIDIIFANEQEALAFTGCEPEEALAVFANQCEIAVVKTGANGSLIQQGQQVYKIDAISAHLIDTTGAGDVYAAGFLHGIINNLPLAQCGKIGALLAGNVIGNLGAKIPQNKWEDIRKQIAMIYISSC